MTGYTKCWHDHVGRSPVFCCHFISDLWKTVYNVNWNVEFSYLWMSFSWTHVYFPDNFNVSWLLFMVFLQIFNVMHQWCNNLNRLLWLWIKLADNDIYARAWDSIYVWILIVHSQAHYFWPLDSIALKNFEKLWHEVTDQVGGQIVSVTIPVMFGRYSKTSI